MAGNSGAGSPVGAPDQWLPRAAAARGNLVRLLGIAIFYGIHLLHFWFPDALASLGNGPASQSIEPLSSTAHLAVSLVVLGWLVQGFVIHLETATGRFSSRWAVFASLGDAFWLTVALICSRGAASPMVAGYFLIIALAGLWLDLRLVRWTTVFCAAGYLVLLVLTRWPALLTVRSALPEVPRYHQAMVLMAIVLQGVLVGQIVRLAWGVVGNLSRRAGANS